MADFFFRLFRRGGRFVFLGAIVLGAGLIWALEKSDLLPRQRGSVGEVAGTMWGAVRVALAVGLVATAAVQALKSLTSLRGWFHRNEISRYTGATAWAQLNEALAVHPTGDGRPTPGAEFARRSLRFYYDLPLEQLMGQVSAALERALAEPDRFEALLDSLGGGLEPDELMVLARIGKGGDEEEAFVTRSRVALTIQRSVDSMQIVIGYRWRWFIRSLTVVIALGLSTVASLYVSAGTSARLGLIASSALLGAFFSWVTRDVFAAVERVRR